MKTVQIKRIQHLVAGAALAWLVVGTNSSQAQIPTSGLQLYLNADTGVEKAPGTPAANTDQVVRWLDQSGQGNNVSTNNSTDGTVTTPQYFTGVVNGRPIVTFDGIRERLEAAAPLLTGTTDFSIFAVIRGSGAGERVIGANYGFTAGGGLELYVYNRKLTLWNAGINPVGSTTLTDGTWYLVEATRSGTSYTLRVNDLVDATTTGSGNITSPLNWTVGDIPDYFAAPFGDFAAELVYNRALTATEHNFVARRLADNYNLDVIPEPTSTVLAAFGVVLALIRRRRN